MKLNSPAAGGLEIHLEHPAEWMLLLALPHDASPPDFDLATGVGARMENTAGWDDWREWVIPDLRDGFHQQLQTVVRAIDAGRGEGGFETGVVVIPRTEFLDWYGALNQARLALEAVHQFGPKPLAIAEDHAPERRAAYFRSQFYSFLQSNLLEMGLE